MKYDPKRHKRKSIRLKGYDYSLAGMFFITICTKNRESLFGTIENNEMVLNAPGQMIEKWYLELENKFPDIECHEYKVMPNHFHAIIINNGKGNPNITKKDPIKDEIHDIAPVGADLCVRPDPKKDHDSNLNIDPNFHLDSNVNLDPNFQFPLDLIEKNMQEGRIHGGLGQTHRSAPIMDKPSNILGEHVGSPLQRVVQWFKTMTTNEYIRGVKSLNWEPFDKKLFQRNYYEHIIRNQKSYQHISDYIINNPHNWKDDRFFI